MGADVRIQSRPLCRVSVVEVVGRKLGFERPLANSNKIEWVHFASRSVLGSCDLLCCDDAA